jgi:hypothetical protein
MKRASGYGSLFHWYLIFKIDAIFEKTPDRVTSPVKTGEAGRCALSS